MKNPTLYFASTTLLFCLAAGVYAQGIDSILSLGDSDGHITIGHNAATTAPDALTISLWLNRNTHGRSNSPEIILSKRKYSNLDDFTKPENWQIFDATNESGGNDVRGFVGAAFDGRYIYCSPWWKGQTQSGKILRYDTKQPYADADGWAVYNAENEDGHANLRGLEGNVFDGRYVYFVPLHHDGEYFAEVLRYDTKGAFEDPASWDVFNAGQIDSTDSLKGFVGAVFDGSNIYFVPNPFAPHSKVLKYNTTKSFQDPAAWSFFSLWDIPTYTANNGFFGGIFDGRFLYLVPFNQNGTVVRFDTTQDFLSEDSWSTVDFNFLLGGRVHGTYTGAAFDGKYIYFSPASGGKVVRFNTSLDFFAASSWEIANILPLDAELDVQGGVGPTYDGRYVYFPPMYAAEGRSGVFVVYDTHKDFSDLTSWRHHDLSAGDAALKGFEGAVYDGEHVYFLPMNFEVPHGKIPRYKTHGNDDLSFELRFMGNSSSFGSTPGKLSVSIGTQTGTRTAFADSSPEALGDNEWHHVAVTYDGTSLRIFIDGTLNSEQIFSQVAPIVWNDANIAIGNSEGSRTNGYHGFLNDLAIWGSALNESEIGQVIEEGPSPTDSDLVGYWSFDSGTFSGKVEDLSPHGNHSISASKIAFRSAIWPSENSKICQSDSSVTLNCLYPGGGIWTGEGIDQSGIFNPTLAGAGIHAATYQTTQNFGSSVKTFSATTYITVDGSQLATPALIQPGPYTLESTVEGPQYQWTRNDTLLTVATKTLPLKGTGSYKVRVSDNVGCFTEFSEAINILEWSAPAVSQIGFATLEALGSGDSFLWYRNDTLIDENAGRLKILMSGHYTVKAIDAFGNVSPLSAPYECVIPAKPDVERTGLYTLKTTISGSRYDWYLNDSLLDENTAEIKALHVGNYTVRVMDSLGTYSSVSEHFHNQDNWLFQADVGEYHLDMGAGETQTVCPTVSTYTMTGFYPPGGTWSGPAISAEGLFTCGPEFAGTMNTVVYSITRTFGETSRTYTATKDVYVDPIPSIASSGQTICNGKEITLTAEDEFVSYLWSTGDTTRTIVISSPGEYSLTARTRSSCSTTSEPLTITAEELPTPKISNTGLFELHASIDMQDESALAYRWTRNDSLLAESTASVHDNETGYYRTQAISQSGCESEFSDAFLYESIVDIDQPILVYPNPTIGYFNVTIPEEQEWVAITISTPRGRQLYHGTYNLKNEPTILTFDVTGFYQTFYLVTIETASERIIRKLVVRTSH